MSRPTLLPLLAALAACTWGGPPEAPGPPPSDTDVDSDSDAPVDSDTDEDSDADTDTDGPAPDSGLAPTVSDIPAGTGCQWRASSTLPGVALAGGAARCTWAAADVPAEGVLVPFTLTVADEMDAEDVVVEAVYAPCASPGSSGLLVAGVVAGDSARYCPSCDIGNCPQPTAQEPPPTSPLSTGVYPGVFTWRALRWDGPSDFGATPQGPLPAGRYTLRLQADGTYGGVPFTVVAEAPLELTAP